MLNNSVVALLCESEITEIAATRLGSLNAMGIIGSWDGRGQWCWVILKRKIGVVTLIQSDVKAVTKID